MITLDEFVLNTLRQITEAVRKFDDEDKSGLASVQPRITGGTDPQKWSEAGFLYTGRGENGEAQYATIVDFDIAVTAEEADIAAGGGGVKVLSFLSAEGKIEGSSRNATVNRIRFKVPLQVRASETKQPPPPKPRKERHSGVEGAWMGT